MLFLNYISLKNKKNCMTNDSLNVFLHILSYIALSNVTSCFQFLPIKIYDVIYSFQEGNVNKAKTGSSPVLLRITESA